MAEFLSIKANIRDAVRSLTLAQQKQIPFATAKALTALAFEVQVAERQGIKDTFKHPRPFSQRGVLVTKATKAAQVATVYLRDEVAAYLAPFEFGGPQRVPGKGIAVLRPVAIRTDAYGQIRGKPSTIADKPNVFAGQVKTKRGLVWGFWQRMKGKAGTPRLKLLVQAAGALTVQPKLNFADRARAVVATRARAVFDDALAQATAAAR